MISQFRDALAGRDKAVLDRPDLRPAAVLLLLYEKRGWWHILLTKRTSRVENHRGDISFPGGAVHVEDASLAAAALRETEEEVGVPVTVVELLGELDDISTRSGYLVRPYVGAVRHSVAFRPNVWEVAELVEIPLPALVVTDAWRDVPRLYEERLIPGLYFEYGPHVVWGATARMLRQFVDLCLADLDRTS